MLSAVQGDQATQTNAVAPLSLGPLEAIGTVLAPTLPISQNNARKASSTQVTEETDRQRKLGDVKRALRQKFAETGVIDDVTARLRRQFVVELKRQGLGIPGARQAVEDSYRSPNGLSLRERVLHSLVVDYLTSNGLLQTLAIFLPESGLGGSAKIASSCTAKDGGATAPGPPEFHTPTALSREDILRGLPIPAESELFRRVLQRVEAEDGKRRVRAWADTDQVQGADARTRVGLLDVLMTEVLGKSREVAVDTNTQTDEPGRNHKESLVIRLEAVRETWLKRAEDERREPARDVTERMLAFQRECEARSAKQMKAEIQTIRERELASLRLQMTATQRREVDAMRRELQSHYDARVERLEGVERERERRAAERLRDAETSQFEARQNLLREMDLLRAREQEARRTAEMDARAVRAEEMRLRDLSTTLETRAEELRRREREGARGREAALEAAKHEARQALELREEGLARDRKLLREEMEAVRAERDACREQMSSHAELAKALQKARRDALAHEARAANAEAETAKYKGEASIYREAYNTQREVAVEGDTKYVRLDRAELESRVRHLENSIADTKGRHARALRKLAEERDALKEEAGRLRKRECRWEEEASELRRALASADVARDQAEHRAQEEECTRTALESQVGDLRVALRRSRDAIEAISLCDIDTSARATVGSPVSTPGALPARPSSTGRGGNMARPRGSATLDAPANCSVAPSPVTEGFATMYGSMEHFLASEPWGMEHEPYGVLPDLEGVLRHGRSVLLARPSSTDDGRALDRKLVGQRGHSRHRRITEERIRGAARTGMSATCWSEGELPSAVSRARRAACRRGRDHHREYMSLSSPESSRCGSGHDRRRSGRVTRGNDVTSYASDNASSFSSANGGREERQHGRRKGRSSRRRRPHRRGRSEASSPTLSRSGEAEAPSAGAVAGSADSGTRAIEALLQQEREKMTRELETARSALRKSEAVREEERLQEREAERQRREEAEIQAMQMRLAEEEARAAAAAITERRLASRIAIERQQRQEEAEDRRLLERRAARMEKELQTQRQEGAILLKRESSVAAAPIQHASPPSPATLEPLAKKELPGTPERQPAMSPQKVAQTDERSHDKPLELGPLPDDGSNTGESGANGTDAKEAQRVVLTSDSTQSRLSAAILGEGEVQQEHSADVSAPADNEARESESAVSLQSPATKQVCSTAPTLREGVAEAVTEQAETVEHGSGPLAVDEVDDELGRDAADISATEADAEVHAYREKVRQRRQQQQQQQQQKQHTPSAANNSPGAQAALEQLATDGSRHWQEGLVSDDVSRRLSELPDDSTSNLEAGGGPSDSDVGGDLAADSRGATDDQRAFGCAGEAAGPDDDVASNTHEDASLSCGEAMGRAVSRGGSDVSPRGSDDDDWF